MDIAILILLILLIVGFLFLFFLLQKKIKILNFTTTTDKIKSPTDQIIKSTIVSAINYLAKEKTGAFIVIEKTNDLTPFIKNGLQINCVLNQDLICSLFNKASLLHDGAFIIKNNCISHVNVFFDVTTDAELNQTINYKYGSRLRTAYYVSTISDALIIAVRETDGKIYVFNEQQVIVNGVNTLSLQALNTNVNL